MTRAPHPALSNLYRQAGAPSRSIERLRRADTALAALWAEPVAGGVDGDALVVRLTSGLHLGDTLLDVLARLNAGPVEAEPVLERSVDRVIALPWRERDLRARSSGSSELLGKQRHGTASEERRSSDEPGNSAQPRNFAQPRKSAQPRNAEEPRNTRRPRPRPLIDAAAAHERLLALAERAGVVETLDQPVIVRVQDRVARTESDAGARADGATGGTSIDPSAAPRLAETAGAELELRLAAILTRADRGAIRRERPSSTSSRTVRRPGTSVPSPDTRRPVPAAPSETWPATGASVADSPSPRPVRRASTPVPVPAPRLFSAPAGGFRGLAELGRSLTPASIAPTGAEPAPPLDSSPSAHAEVVDLASRIADLLRRDAERHGIDMTGVEP
jgi:hypothetical protein